MLNRDIIQNTGFTNTVRDGEVVGFEFRVRNPNYRGVSSSLVDGVAVTLGGHTWSEAETTLVLGGREFDLASLRTSTGARWPLTDPVTVRVLLAGGLKAGVHHLSVDIRLRAPYFPIEFQPNITHAERAVTLVDPVASPAFQYGVSTYSYTDDLYTLLSLEDALAEVADLGATGIEILGEANVPGYPNPSSAWIDEWHALVAKYQLTPTNFGSWIDSRMWLERDLTAVEGAEQLSRDIKLAAELGFSFVRPKIGVISLDLVPHPIWDEAVARCLDLAHELGIVIAPEIHSPTPIRHEVVDGYLDFIERTGTKNFGLLIDTGIFMTKSAFQGWDLNSAPLSEEDIPVPLRALKVPASDLVDIMKHVVFIQAKFYEVDENLVDPHIPWREVFTVLKEQGYTGFLSSEYEGPRQPYRGIEQVRRQHSMFHQLERELFA